MLNGYRQPAIVAGLCVGALLGLLPLRGAELDR